MNFICKIGILIAVISLVSGQNAQGQEADDNQSLQSEVQALKSEVQKLQTGQEAIRKELATLVRLLARQQQAEGKPRMRPFAPLDLAITNAPSMGNMDAPVTLVEFTDYQCPFCKRYNAEVKPQLLKEYVESGKLRYIMKEFPITRIHPRAAKAAEAALCAGDQGQHWELHDVLFANQQTLGLEDLARHAQSLNLDMTQFANCLEGGKYTLQVRQDVQQGVQARVTGTPTFFLGLSDPASPGKIKATKQLVGAQPFGQFKKTIDALLVEFAKRS